MSKYKVGDKFVVEVESECAGIVEIKGIGSLSQIAVDKLDRLDGDYINEHFGELQDEAYSKGVFDGRNDVWEFVKKCWNMSVLDTREIFGYEYVKGILDNFTPQEALAKLKAYEEAQIEVGDVVKVKNGYEFLVTHISKEKTHYFGITKTGDTYTSVHISQLEKTGKHIDIKAILEQIGE